jgi:ferredoxin
VRDCICRTQTRLVGKGCDHPVRVCLSFSPAPGRFDADPQVDPLTREEALALLDEAAEAGLIHTVGNHRDDHYYVCNCCTCSCGVLRGMREFDRPAAVARSAYLAVVETDDCIGCGACETRCSFGAVLLSDGVAAVDEGRCVGCGQCVTVCPSGALTLTARPDADREPVPASLGEWMRLKAAARGLDMRELL